MRAIFLTVLLSTFAHGCSKPAEPHTVDWRRLNLAGKTLVRTHPTEIRTFPFRRDGTVVATIGNHGDAGPIAGPILFWGIAGDKLIVSRIEVTGAAEVHGDPSTEGSAAVEILKSPALMGETLTATRPSGERVSYRLIKSE